jgi:hypothetical protein
MRPGVHIHILLEDRMAGAILQAGFQEPITKGRQKNLAASVSAQCPGGGETTGSG